MGWDEMILMGAKANSFPMARVMNLSPSKSSKRQGGSTHTALCTEQFRNQQRMKSAKDTLLVHKIRIRMQALLNPHPIRIQDKVFMTTLKNILI
jgi:hypothetical protein